MYILIFYLLPLYIYIMELLVFSTLIYGGYHINKGLNKNKDNIKIDNVSKEDNTILSFINSKEKQKLLENLSEKLHNKSNTFNSNIIKKDGLSKYITINNQIRTDKQDHMQYINSLNKFNELLPDNLKKEEENFINKLNGEIGYNKNCNINNINSSCVNESWENMFISSDFKGHNNMTPFFGSNIQQNIDNNEMQKQKVNNFEITKPPKKEVVNFSDSWNNRQDIYGNKRNANSIKYYIPSKLKKNILPFEQIKVGPGLNLQYDTLHHKKGFHDNFRVREKTVNELRSKINPKIIYKGKIIHGKSKIDKRQLNSNVIKHKPEQFKILSINDLFRTTGAFLKETLYGKIHIKDSKINSKEYYGSLGNMKKSKLPENYKKSNKSETNNNYISNCKGSNKQKSYITDKAKPTIKETTENNDYMGNIKIHEKKYVKYGDKANTTIRETLQNVDSNLNLMGTVKQTRQFNDKAKLTIRETLSNVDNSGNITGNTKLTNKYTDRAKTTLKELTEENVNIGNLKLYIKNIVNYVDKAKTTIRELTENNIHNGNLQTNTKEIMQFFDKAKETLKEINELNLHNGNILSITKPILKYIDEAKNTIRETTEHNYHNGNINTYNREIKSFYDVAKTTLKELNENNYHTGNLNHYLKNIVNYIDKAKTTLRESTENNEYNGNLKTNAKEIMQFFDKAKETLKEINEINLHNGNILSITKPVLNYIDEAKTTVKELTENNYYNGQLSTYKKQKSQLNDKMKVTAKETTVESNRLGNMGSKYKKHMKKLEDKIKVTLKETLVDNERDGNISGKLNQKLYLFDKAKTTLKELNEINNYISGLSGNLKIKKYQEDEAKKTNKEDTSNNDYYNNAKSFLNKEINIESYENAHTNSVKEIISKGRENTWQGPKKTIDPQMYFAKSDNQQMTDFPIMRGNSTITNKFDNFECKTNKNLYSTVCRLDSNILDSLKMNPYNVKKIYDNSLDCK